MKFFILILVFTLSSGDKPLSLSNRVFNHVLDQPCPNVTPVPSINVDKLSGTWYAVITSQNTRGRPIECLRFTLTPAGDYQANVTFCEKNNGVHKCHITRNDFIEQNGKYTLTFYGTESFITANIISLNYDEYYVVSECQDLEKEKSLHNIWIASRTPTLSDELRQEINKKLTGIFDTKTLKDVRHKNCKKVD